MVLRKVISGGQTGADLAGLVVAKRFGLQTGGWMPKGFKTLNGPRLDMARLYNCEEHASPSYGPRTEVNVAESCGTVRLAGDFLSSGEVCTLRAIKKNKKPYYDVDLCDPPNVKEFVDWIAKNNIEVLNVAGNSERTYDQAYRKSFAFLVESFFYMGLEMTISNEDILFALNLPKSNMVIFNEDRQLIDRIKIRRMRFSQKVNENSSVLE